MKSPHRTKRATLAAIAVAISLIATACGGGTDTETSVADDDTTTTTEVVEETTTTEAALEQTTTTAEAPETTTTSTAVVEETTAEEEDEIVEASPDIALDDPVVLIDAGSEPRTELRFMLTAGTSELRMTQSQSISQTIDGLPLAEGEVQTINSVTSVTVTPNGDLFVVDSIIDSMAAAPDTDPAQAAILDAALSGSIGLTTQSIIDNRGLVDTASADNVNSEAVGELLDATSQTSSPLPAEPVGVGAVWETTQNIVLFGLDVEQITTSTITAIEGNTVSLSTETVQNVEPGSVGDVQGQQLIVEFWESTSTGTVTLDLTEVSPVTSTASTVSRQGFEVGGALLEQDVTIEITITGG